LPGFTGLVWSDDCWVEASSSLKERHSGWRGKRDSIMFGDRLQHEIPHPQTEHGEVNTKSVGNYLAKTVRIELRARLGRGTALQSGAGAAVSRVEEGAQVDAVGVAASRTR
jgi:hypothetical protein